MMRSLWTGASGMIAQQTNVDTISNNLANVNTTAYKKERLEFKSLLYQTMQRADLDPANQTGTRPVNLQVGLGVRPIATARFFDVGNMEITDNKLDFAIQGSGFFSVRTGEDTSAYTRDGCFKISYTDEGKFLVTSDGYAVLDANGDTIIFPPELMLSDLSIDYLGNFFYTNAEGTREDLGFQLDVVQFSNVQGLEAIGSNLFVETVASGAPMHEADGDVTHLSTIQQGMREMSNVLVAEEMVKLIVAQRAYELNSKVITTSDDMLQQANNLKRT